MDGLRLYLFGLLRGTGQRNVLLGVMLALLSALPAYTSPIILDVPDGMGIPFVESCLRHEIPVKMAYDLIMHESRWDERAVNHNRDGSRDLGIMQLNSRYLSEFAERYNNGEPIDPWMWRVSFDIGLAHLATLYRQTGDWKGAVASYNMGLSAYRKYRDRNWRLPSTTRAMLAYVFEGER